MSDYQENNLLKISLSLLENEKNILLKLLRYYQKDSLNMMLKYIAEYRKKSTKKSALVQMPTGSGKSGVITILSTCIKNIGLTLVLTPRKILREQISKDIEGRFFNKIGFKMDKKFKKIINVTKGSHLNLKLTDALGEQVIIMTFNMLSRIYSDRRDIFELLSKKTSLLLVDEGHYEPADNWSICTREINAPIILFTATPYRNDFHVFNIDRNYIYTLTFKSAVEGNYIRDVEVIDRCPLVKSFSSFLKNSTSNVLKEPSDFVKDIIDFYENEKKFSNKENDSPRIIIRCDNKYSIEILAKKFETRGYSCIGIHEDFVETNGWKRKNVPNPEETDAIVWIHQFKLLEGIDDSRFQILAIYEKIKNARSLVQQIGRIIRNPNPTNEKKATSYFLEHWNGFHRSLWEGFLKYDRTLEDHGSNIFYFSTSTEDLIPKLLEIQPKMAYVGGRFCFPFEFKQFNLMEDIQVPLRVNLLNKFKIFKLKEFVNYIKDTYKKDNRESHEYCDYTKNLCIILSFKVRNSPFLRNHTFLEEDLFITVIKEFDNLIAIYDSSGKNWIGIQNLGIGYSLDVEKLKKLFRKGNGARLNTISLLNSNLGTSVIRSRTISAVSIEGTIPGFDDYSQICTTVEGYSSGDVVRQYLGFSHGRISKYKVGFVPLPEYIDWLEYILKVINDDIPILSVFSRYALEKKVPENTEPKCILLDIEEIKDVYFIESEDNTNEEEERLKFDETCQKVENIEFQIKANGEEVAIKVEFEEDSKKYKLTDINNKLTKYSRKKEAEEFPPSVIQYLNQNQSFMVLPETLDTIYVKGQFYSPKMKIGKDFDIKNYGLRSAFILDNKIGNCISEKGPASFYKDQNENWYPDSLFGIISNKCENTNIKKLFGKPDIIVCDDMANEIADFILCYNTKDPRIVFIHAKANSKNDSQCKTSKIHDVCAQAIKNLGYLAMFNDIEPPNLNLWDGPWKSKNSIVRSRIVKPHQKDNASEMWKKIRRIINNPITEKEIWLFLGNILSKKHFEKELGSEKPKPNVIQAAYLLHATMSSVASVGAKFRVFCKK